jgi:type VI protein secretion system component VasF
MKQITTKLAVLALPIALGVMLTSCSDQPHDPDARQERAERERLQERLKEAQQQAAEAQKARQQLEKQLTEIRQAADRDEQTADARVRHQQLDVRVAIIVWAATAVSAVVLGLLLAREHRLRRMLERLLRHLMGRDPRTTEYGDSS